MHQMIDLLQRELMASEIRIALILIQFNYQIWGVRQDCVYQTPVRDVVDLRQRLIDTWYGLSQSVVYDATDEWHNT